MRAGAVFDHKRRAGLAGLALVAVCALAACSRGADAPLPAASAAAAASAPVTASVCGQAVAYPHAPQRAVAHGINIVEMVLALGLEGRLAGYGGVRDTARLPPAMQAQLAGVPDLSSQGMNLETLLGAQADFVFSGWSYGFRAGQVTPDALAEFGIASYVLTESCIRQGPRERVSLHDTFADLLALGRIFRVEARAQALVDAQAAQLHALRQQLQSVAPRPLVFLFDSGTDVPVTAGRYAMPHAMIEAAGGRNLFGDIPSSWTRGNWEDVIARDPDWIVIVDNDRPAADGKRQFLLAQPQLAHLKAVRGRRFVLLDFAEATPGPRNVAATLRIARALHPERVPAP
ncbi:ABC transporter substrate-binding protein [Pulveribacter suum]|uniref:ABC transporter substrate-binding protein n=1 Tax=Pulveribacter suum TaxID=2116657 RepID=A0A2P1NN59_9BURK|nr:ABC transporter substrate-binding protein [Pulveribacter suum]AVP58499.1 ABC transporter substrate-binding protein [Pulveribacter suum]